MSLIGYHGKILHIDLSAQRAWGEEPGDRFWRIYGGGGLLATYYLLRETPAHIDAFDPANLLIARSLRRALHPGTRSGGCAGGILSARCQDGA